MEESFDETMPLSQGRLIRVLLVHLSHEHRVERKEPNQKNLGGLFH